MRHVKFDLRSGGLLFACVLAVYSIWLLATELIRPGLKPELLLATAAQNSMMGSARSSIAASLGMVRGDLWAERAFIDAARVLGDRSPPNAALPQEEASAIRAAAERAAANAPLSPLVWLILATLTYEADPGLQIAREQLKMSYYTGPNDKGIMDRRLRFAARSRAVDDPDLRNAIRREIRTILLRAPDLRPALVSAYRGALPDARRFIEATVSEVDPRFLFDLRRAASL